MNVVFLLLTVSVSLTDTQEPVTDGTLFVPYGQPVPLRVMNITQFAARLQWTLPMKTKEMLKAIRINCTTVKSLIEPYENQEPDIHLYNPSVLGEQIILNDLKPATQYSCKLVGALSLDLGREKLAILSETTTFSTLLEEEDHKVYVEEVPKGLSMLHIILGVTIPMVIISTAIVLMIVGYFTYRRQKRGGPKGKKYRMNVSKNANLPPEDPPPPSSGKKTADKGSRRKSRKSDDKGKGAAGKRRPTAHPGKVSPSGKEPVASHKGKKPVSGGKKPAKKKKGSSIYSELQMHSDEEDSAHELKGTDDLLTSDLGWDPTAYYPHPPNQQPAAHPPPLSKHIDVRGELSSPLIMPQSGESALGLAPIKHKRKHKHHHHSHYKKPLY